MAIFERRSNSGECCLPTDKQSTPEQIRERQTDIVRIIITIARAAHHAHENSILHRDLTPANILFDNQGEPYLSDFGLAKILNKPPEDGVPTLTMSDIVMGVPSYMSPEQAACKPLTVASDVYSLGAILYQMLTGQRPFKAENHILTLDLVQKQPPTRLRVLNPRIDIGLEAICLRCLEKKPEARYISALLFAEDLQRWLEGKRPLAQRSPVVVLATRTKQWMQSNPLGTALIASLCACLALALFVAKMLYDERQQADIARSFLRLKFETDNQQLWEDPNRFFLEFHPAEWATLSREFTPRVPTPDTIPLTFAFNTPENPTERAERFAPFLRALEDKMELLLGHPVAITLRLYKPDVPQLLADARQGQVRRY